MIIKIFSFFIVVCSLILGTSAYAGTTLKKAQKAKVSTQKLLRFTDTKEEYGKSCEEYSYIDPEERFKLLKQNTFMFGDILTDSLSISHVYPDQLVETNLTECNIPGMNVSEYTYRESLEYLSEDIITIEVFQYAYGAGAAHGNGHMSHYIYDREYGMELNWEDFFGKSYAFDLYVLKRVVKEIADKEFIAYFKAEEQLLNFRHKGYYAITDEGLLVQYGKYEITPGAAGLPSLVVPKEILKEYMSQEMYAKCFVSNEQMILEVMNAF